MATSIPFASALAVVLDLTLLISVAPSQCTTDWSTGGNAGVGGPLTAVAPLADGGIAGAALLSVASGATQVLRFDGTTWQPLGGTTNGQVKALVALPNGDLVAGGRFTAIGPVSAIALARWDGQAWSSFGGGANGFVEALLVLPNGDLVVGGQFTAVGGTNANRIALHDGSGWQALGSGIGFAGVNALARLPAGDIVAAGAFLMAGGNPAPSIARWNGSAWNALPPAFNQLGGSFYALQTLPNGDLAAAGGFTGGLRRWDGTSWSDFGGATLDSTAESFAVLPNGDLVVGGHFTAVSTIGSTPHIARWNGTTWSALGSGVDGAVIDLAMLPAGRLVAGGVFTVVAGNAQPHVAFLDSDCPASAVAAGAGCSGSAGLNELSATNLPWTGSTFRATAVGMTQNALAVALFGLTPQSVALSTLVPEAVAGCALLASTESAQLLLPSAGSAATQLAIPNSVVFAGVTLYHQVVAAELSPQNRVTAVTSTNALAFTIGTF
ncbi:MAG: hypothetical protein KDE27_10295 [Planctomycetes bacterium]|nr:hypothetical protein [Planctomycetota bacterium]